MTSMTKEFNFFLKSWVFSCFWLLLNSYHIIQSLYPLSKYHFNPIGLKKTFSGSQMKVLERSSWFHIASTFSSRTFLMIFWFLPVFVFVIIVIRLVVMSYWPPLLDKHPHIPIEAYMGVFFDFRWKFLNLMAVKNLKYFFQCFFEH